MPRNGTAPKAGALTRRFTQYTGLFFDAFAGDSAWIREEGVVRLPPLEGVRALVLRGEFRPHPEARGAETPYPGLRVSVAGRPAASLAGAGPGPWELKVDLPEAGRAGGTALALRLTGVGFTNALAWLGRVTGLGPLQRFRAQRRNRQLRLASISSDSGTVIFDFSRRHAPLRPEFARRHGRLGMNIVGFLAADLGVGESARCMVRAADAAGIPAALVPLKLNCLNRMGDRTYASRLQDANPHGVNVIHIDPPAARDIDHHHGPGFREGRYNVAYFAWELPDFPDAWMPSLDFFDEVWCPSQFTRESIAMKSPHPVLTMPHAIGFARPEGGAAALRGRFGLPAGPFLFLSLFDLNSTAARKNPAAAVAAYRESGLRPPAAGLVVKVQNAEANPADFAALRASLRDLPGAVLISDTLSREDTYALEAACDCFVSLHRAEGFGLAVAESMYLGRPAISTDWSATAEFVTPDTGFPVRCRIAAIESNHGPYARGSHWAEPDVSLAAEAMRRLAGDPALAARLGAAARASMEERFSPAVIGARYRSRLEAIASF
jgi:glycosyltransferase involved in cell wall biosynthesis